ncbi:hypothetical protein GCM10027610_020280 [Dactylosporangium cerinum]
MHVLLQEVHQRRVERREPLGRRGAGPERWRSGQHLGLQRPLVLVEECHGDRGAVGIAAVQRGPPDAGRLRDVVHGDLVRAPGGEQFLRRGEDPGPVAGRVRPLDRHAPTVPPTKWTPCPLAR